MMLSRLLALGAALFASSSLALPASEARASECSFHAKVTQICNHGNAYTSLTIPQIYADKKTINPNGGKRSTLMTPWNIKGLGKDFVVEFKDGAVTYIYGNDKWDGHHGDKFTCEVGEWSAGELDCQWAGSRAQDMDCTFECTAAKVETPKPRLTEPVQSLTPSTISARNESPLDNDLNALSTSIVQTPGTSLAPAYVHGYCSFKMQLMQQCLSNPTKNWHYEMLGNLFSIQDAAGKTVIAFPEGAGRIDHPHVKKLTGMGDDGLLITHKDNKVYFGFDGGRWDTGTKDDGKVYGLCNWGAWSRGEWGCEPRFGGERRTSDIACVFKC